jgi:hypothetical protein
LFNSAGVMDKIRALLLEKGGVSTKIIAQLKGQKLKKITTKVITNKPKENQKKIKNNR